MNWLITAGILLAIGALCYFSLAGCGSGASDRALHEPRNGGEESGRAGGQYSQPGPGQYSDGINPYPEKENGEPSEEFEPEDIERAEEGYEDEALREYCGEAVSEAQEVGCLSHVDPSEVP